MQSRGSAFVISLDFELMWGVKDVYSVADYGRNILGEREIVPRLLDLFCRYGVRATWATVGFLFFDEKEELLSNLPSMKPNYCNPTLSSYFYLKDIGRNERADPYHYGLSLVRQIQSADSQEIGTHTFSHYYCLEQGQSKDEFGCDLVAACGAAERIGVVLRSLVFPRKAYPSGSGAAHMRWLEAVATDKMLIAPEATA